MALRDQPYLPLYVQDFLTDEKLNCCSLSTQGVYIRIICALHKSDTYGGILFKQIPKQNLSSVDYFVFVLSRQIGVDKQDVSEALQELLFFEVMTLGKLNDTDFLYQKRMVKDFDISMKRSKAGKSGGGNPQLSDKNLYKQNDKQIPEYESKYRIGSKEGGVGETKPETPPLENPPDIKPEPVGSERAQKAAHESWRDEGWRNNICMAQSLNVDELKKWMAAFNASISNDVIHEFDSRAYRKMFGGWLSRQKSKGYALVNENSFSDMDKLRKWK